MKKLAACLLAVIMFSNVAFASEVEFPVSLSPGKYEIVVPQNDIWTLHNATSYKELKLLYVDAVLAEEKGAAVCVDRTLELEEVCASRIKIAENIKQINIDQLTKENDKLKDELGSKYFLGISKTKWSFILGVVLSFGAMYGAAQLL